MNDLPQQGNIASPEPSQPAPVPGGPGLAKEGEGISSSELPIEEIGKEVEPPKEVVSAGVKTTPTVINLPKPITQMGVKPAGPNITVGTGSTVVLPLTQPQITQGLQKSILDSWRWLAVWCIRRLKQLRFFNPTNTTNPINPTNDK